LRGELRLTWEARAGCQLAENEVGQARDHAVDGGGLGSGGASGRFHMANLSDKFGQSIGEIPLGMAFTSSMARLIRSRLYKLI